MRDHFTGREVRPGVDGGVISGMLSVLALWLLFAAVWLLWGAL